MVRSFFVTSAVTNFRLGRGVLILINTDVCGYQDTGFYRHFYACAWVLTRVAATS